MRERREERDIISGESRSGDCLSKKKSAGEDLLVPTNIS
jgi:hypothetical protein